MKSVRRTAIVGLLTVGLYLLRVYAGEQIWFWSLLLDGELTHEVWRFVSAHFIHTDLEHLVWNLAALVVLGLWVEHKSPRFLLSTLFSSAVLVGFWFLFQNQFDYYCGWSGALNGLFVMALYLVWQAPVVDRRRRVNNVICILVAFGFVAKNVYEWQQGGLLGVGLWPAAAGAHVAGMLGGLLMVVLHEVVDPRVRVQS